jgi:hypothetical protein
MADGWKAAEFSLRQPPSKQYPLCGMWYFLAKAKKNAHSQLHKADSAWFGSFSLSYFQRRRAVALPSLLPSSFSANMKRDIHPRKYAASRFILMALL